MTKTKTKPPPRAKAARKKIDRAEFVAGDSCEFVLAESADGVRPQGNAKIERVDQATAKLKMYLLNVTSVAAGNPDALRNPSGELWAMDNELELPGSRQDRDEAAAVATAKAAKGKKADKPADVPVPPTEKKPPVGLPVDFRKLKEQTQGALLLFRNGTLYEAFNGDAAVVGKAMRLKLGQRDEVACVAIILSELGDTLQKLVKEGHRVAVCEVAKDAEGHAVDRVDGPEDMSGLVPPVPLAQDEAIKAACVILFEETKRNCDVVQLAGKFKAGARKHIAAKLLGREPSHDEFGVSSLRDYFRNTLEIDSKLTSDEADQRIAQRAIEIVQAIDAQEAKAAEIAGVSEEQPQSEEPSGEQSAAGAAADTNPANESETEMATATKTRKAKTRSVHLAFGEHGAGPVIRALRKEEVAAEHLPAIMKGLGFKITDAYIAMKFKQKTGKKAAELNKEQWAEIRKLCPAAFKK